MKWHTRDRLPQYSTYEPILGTNFLNSSVLEPRIVAIIGLQDQNLGAATYQLGNTSSRTISEVKQR